MASAARKGVSRAAARPPYPNREKAAPRSAAALTVLIGRYLHRPSPAALKPPLGHIRPITKNDLGALRRIITLIPSGMVLMESCLASVI